jgi:hypothetical protein
VAVDPDFAKDKFRIDLEAGTVTCPARVTTAILPASRGGVGPGSAPPAASARCVQPVPAVSGVGWSPSIPERPNWPLPVPASVTPPGWPTTGPPGPRSSVSSRICSVAATAAGAPRVRGLVRVAQDFKLLAAAVNLARFATLGLRHNSTGWQVQPA